MTYSRAELKAPRLTGMALRAVVSLAEMPGTSTLLRAQMLAQIGIPAWRRRVIDDPSEPRPRFAGTDLVDGPQPDLAALVEAAPACPPFESVADFARAYRDGRTTPEQVADRLVQAIDASEHLDTPLRVFVRVQADDIRRQASASARRLREGQALGPLDGVPVAVKDELDVAGYPTTVGTGFLGQSDATVDATVVARWRAAGALIIGKANMHEIGIGVTGLNPHHGACRNPYDPSRKTGGSSSGPAAAVAAGLCPLAIGADGGGSIRLPSALCGVFGLKPSYGRVSEHGAAQLCWSVAHVGPIAATASDLALGYALMAGPDPKDPSSLGQPSVHLEGFNSVDLKGLRVGVYRAWFEDAEPEVVRVCQGALDSLAALGAQVVEVEIPDLGDFHLAHLVTIVSEMLAAMRPHLDEPARFGADVRLNLALAQGLSSEDYVRAQRWRARAMRTLDGVLSTVDVVATPTSALTAPPIAADALDGESDLVQLNAIMRYATLGNLTGLPVISIPVGQSHAGLPVGLQLLARGWHEHLLLRAARALETTLTRGTPRWQARLLPPTP
ncbi:MAG: amidase [Pseudomonadota bacterium]